MWYVSYNYELSGVRETYSSGKKKNQSYLLTKASYRE